MLYANVTAIKNFPHVKKMSFTKRLLVLLEFRIKNGKSGENKQDEKVELRGGQVREGRKKYLWPWR